VEGRLPGTIDLPLAEFGIKQAIANVAVIRDLGVRRIVCSTARPFRGEVTQDLLTWLPGRPAGRTMHLLARRTALWKRSDSSCGALKAIPGIP